MTGLARSKSIITWRATVQFFYLLKIRKSLLKNSFFFYLCGPIYILPAFRAHLECSSLHAPSVLGRIPHHLAPHPTAIVVTPPAFRRALHRRCSHPRRGSLPVQEAYARNYDPSGSMSDNTKHARASGSNSDFYPQPDLEVIYEKIASDKRRCATSPVYR